MSNMDHYTKFIAEQARKNGTALSEAHEVPKEILKHDPDAIHVGSTKEGHHVYAGGETDRGESSYYTVKHPDGKITHHSVEHGGEAPSARELSKKSDWHDVHDLHPGVRKIMHKDMKSELE